MVRKETKQITQQCSRCGICCKKGGPALHAQDRGLVESGRIPLTDLYTIRAGELVRDNVRGTLQSLATEIVKIKTRSSGSQTCRYYTARDSACRIYATRPLECRALPCWDTREIERIYHIGRLRRKDLLKQVEGLWELIADHERRCSCEKLRRLVKRLKTDGRQADADQLLEIIQYDSELRHLVVETAGLDPEVLDFLFGRLLAETVGQQGVRLQRQGGKITRLVIENQPLAPRLPCRWAGGT